VFVTDASNREVLECDGLSGAARMTQQAGI
jgi:hypothetical protein